MNIVNTTLDRLNLKRFFQGEGPQQQPIQFQQHKVYILPTRQGIIFSILLLIMLVGSINYTNSLGFILTFLLASLAVIAILFTYRNLLNLQISIGNINPVYCEQLINIPFLIGNINYDRLSITIAYCNHSHVYDLISDTQQNIIFPLPTTTRGEHKLERFTFSTTFPLGLFRAWSYFEIEQYYYVYPKPQGNPQLPNHTFYKATLLGDQGYGTDDFAGLRKYVPGDSLKQINWKALAKGQDILTKQFGGDRSDQLWLDWQYTEGLQTEDRLSQLALWILETERQGISYALKLPQIELLPSNGELHLNKCMMALAKY